MSGGADRQLVGDEAPKLTFIHFSPRYQLPPIYGRVVAIRRLLKPTARCRPL
jgi:hypothetical protein